MRQKNEHCLIILYTKGYLFGTCRVPNKLGDILCSLELIWTPVYTFWIWNFVKKRAIYRVLSGPPSIYLELESTNCTLSGKKKLKIISVSVNALKQSIRRHRCYLCQRKNAMHPHFTGGGNRATYRISMNERG